MSVFLVSVGEQRSRSLNSRNDDTAGHQMVARRLSETCSRWIGKKYSRAPNIFTDGGDLGFVGLVWESSSTRSSLVKAGGCVVLSSDAASASDLAADVHRVGGRLVYSRPVWGSYSAILYERNEQRLTAWGTSPSLETIYYGENGGKAYFSNRAILVAEALRANGQCAVDLNSEFYSEFLLYGYSITGATPFSGVRVLDNQCSVIADRSGLVSGEMPPGLEFGLHPSHTPEEGAEALATSLRESTARCVDRLESASIEFRLSAGKDSRLLLGLLRELGVPGYAVTFGRPVGDSEVELASQLAELAQFPHIVSSPKFAPGETIRERSIWTLRNSGGLPLSESHGMIYRGAEPRTAGDGLMLGQWPLMKGGLAKRMRLGPGEALQAVHNQGSGIVKSSVRRIYDEFLTRWFSNCSAQNDIDRLYMFSRQFRSGRWLQASIALYSQESEIVYPISDAAVTSVADSLTLAEKISDRTLFSALHDIWASSFNVPFASSAWRFPIHEALSDSSRDALERYVGKVSSWSSVSSSIRNVAPEYSAATVSTIAKDILSSPLNDRLGDLLDDKFIRFLEEASLGGSRVFEHQGIKRTAQLVWRVYALTLLDSLEWYL